MKTVIIFVFGFLLLQQPEKAVKLPYGFEIRVSDPEDLDNYFTYSSIAIYHNGNQVYKKKGLREYKFTNKRYPMVFKVSKTEYQILLEVDDRPNGDISELIQIDGDIVYKTEVLPMFYGKSKNLDSDTNLELAGTWSYGEEWKSRNGETVVAYCPVLFYEISQHGLSFDSLTTQKVNTKIYGNYYGPKYNEKIEIPVKKWEKLFDKELDRIQK